MAPRSASVPSSPSRSFSDCDEQDSTALQLAKFSQSFSYGAVVTPWHDEECIVDDTTSRCETLVDGNGEDGLVQEPESLDSKAKYRPVTVDSSSVTISRHHKDSRHRRSRRGGVQVQQKKQELKKRFPKPWQQEELDYRIAALEKNQAVARKQFGYKNPVPPPPQFFEYAKALHGQGQYEGPYPQYLDMSPVDPCMEMQPISEPDQCIFEAPPMSSMPVLMPLVQQQPCPPPGSFYDNYIPENSSYGPHDSKFYPFHADPHSPYHQQGKPSVLNPAASRYTYIAPAPAPAPILKRFQNLALQ